MIKNKESKKAFNESVIFIENIYKTYKMKVDIKAKYSTLALLYVNTIFTYFENVQPNFEPMAIFKQCSTLDYMFYVPYKIGIRIKK